MNKGDVKIEQKENINKKLESYITAEGVDNIISALLSDITDWFVQNSGNINSLDTDNVNISNSTIACSNLIKELQTKFDKSQIIDEDEDEDENKKSPITIEIKNLKVNNQQFVDSIKKNSSIDNMLSQINFEKIEIKVLNNGHQYVSAQLKDDYKKILDDTIRSIVLFLYTREYCKNIKDKEHQTLVKARLVDCLFNMRVYLGMQFIFYKESEGKDAIEYLKFIEYLDDHGLRQKYCEYICRYLNKYPECHSLLSEKKLEKLFDIPLTLNNNSIKLGNKIKIVDERDQLITNLQDIKEKNPGAKISFKVTDSEPIVTGEDKNIEKEKNEIIVNENKVNKENKEIESNNNNDKKVNSNNDKYNKNEIENNNGTILDEKNKIEIENVDQLNIDQIITEINKEAKLLEDLDKYVSECLAKIDPYFQNADAFINFKRNKIKEYLDNIDKFKTYKVQAEDLEKLDNILLSGKTAVAIVKKFNVRAVNTSNMLYSNEIKKANQAVNTFKTLLKNVKKTDEKDEDGKFSSQDFHDFIYNNFAYSDSWPFLTNGKKRVQFSNDDIDNMLDCVNTNDNFFSCWSINNILRYLKLEENAQPSDKLITFLLNSAKMYSIDSFVRIINILSVGFGNIDKTLKCIFDSRFGNSPFYQKLLQIKDIEQKLSPMEILKSSDPETKEFAFYLLANGIEIKIENGEGGVKKFVINKNATKLQGFSEAELIPCLEQEHGLNAFVQKHIADMINDKSKELTNADLINARSDAINAFLNSSEQLKQRYNKLLSRTDLLNTVKLLAETSVYCIDKLCAKLSGHADLKKTLFQIWQLEDQNRVEKKYLNDFLFEGQSMHITKEYLDFCFKNGLIDGNLNLQTHKSLYQLLLALEDGNCTDELLKCFSSALSEKKINFVDLICADQKTENVEQCLANAIYQLIRTSPDYTDFGIGINNDKQIKAISNVLTKDGDGSANYRWFRDGLFTWLSDNKKNIDELLKQNKDLDTMLSVCGITVEYDKKNNKIKCNNSDEIKNASIAVDEILKLFQKTNRDTTVSLSEINRVIKRNRTNVIGRSNVILPMEMGEQNSFISLISEGQIVISTSKISNFFNLESKNPVDYFFKTNDIARQFMWKIIDDELFNPETGLFRETDISEGEICEKYKEGLANCLKHIKIVLGDQKEISVDLSQFKDEFLSSVGIINFDKLFEKYKNLLDLIKNGQFSISDRNFNAFWDFFKAKFDKKQDGQQIIALFEQLTDKIEDFSLSYDNVQQLISTFLNQTTGIKFSQDDIDKFCSITQKLIDKKLKLVQDGDDRFSYNGKAQKIFEDICKFFTNGTNEDKDASSIILILYSLIRKQDECYQCGKLIDMLNASCVKYELNIGDEKLQKARKLISNKIMITDIHTKGGVGYKFVIDFELKDKDDKKHLNIPINVEYTDPNKNVQVTTNLESYINDLIKNKKLNFECDIKKPNSFNSVIEQIENQFYDAKGGVSQATKDINKTSKLDQNDDNLLYVLKSKSQKLSKNTLKNILTEIFESKKIKKEEVFFDQFAPWFVHVLSHYLDLSTFDKGDLSALLEVCIDENLQFKDQNACERAKKFLAECVKATLKNDNKSCVSGLFINSIIERIAPELYCENPESDISCIFAFISEHAYQTNINRDGFNVDIIVTTIMETILLKSNEPNSSNSKDKLLNKYDLTRKNILDKFNNSGLYAFRKKKSTDRQLGTSFVFNIQSASEENTFIKQVEICKESELKYTINATDQNKAQVTNVEKNLELQGEEEKNIAEAFKKWDEDKNRKKSKSIDDVVFLTELVTEKFDELVKSQFGVLDNNAIKGDKKFDNFLDGLAKIVNCLEGCQNGYIKNNLLEKMEGFKSRIQTASLTFEQMTKFLDLVIKIKNWKPNINQFLDWCKKYINADSKKNCRDDLYKYIKDKLQYSSETIQQQLSILEFVIKEKKLTKMYNLKDEIKVFLDSKILSFEKGKYPKQEISSAVARFVDCLKVDINNEDGKSISDELQDMFFNYINSQIFEDDANYHLETNKETKERIKKEIEQQQNKPKAELEQNYRQLKQNIENFLKLVVVTSDNVKNIFNSIDMDFVNGANQFTKQQKVLTEENQNEIIEFIELLSAVNEKMSQIKSDKNEGDNNASVPSLGNFFSRNVLTPEQCTTLVRFMVLSYPYVTGASFTAVDLRNLVADCLQYGADKKTLATNLFQIIDTFKANIAFGIFEDFMIMMIDDFIQFNDIQQNLYADKKAIIESMNKYNILQLFICAECKLQLKDKSPNQSISLDMFNMIKGIVANSVGRVLSEVKGLDIDDNNQLCYNANVKKVDEKRKRIFTNYVLENVIKQLCQDKIITEQQRFFFTIGQLKEKASLEENMNTQEDDEYSNGEEDNEIDEREISRKRKINLQGQELADVNNPNNPTGRRKKILIGVSIVLLILAAAGIAATLWIGLEATAILAGFIVSLAAAAVAVALFIWGLCLKNPPHTPTKQINILEPDGNNLIKQRELAKDDTIIEEHQQENNQNELVEKLIGNNNKDKGMGNNKNNFEK